VVVAACLLATVALAGVSLRATAAPVRALVDVQPLLPSGGAVGSRRARPAETFSLSVGALFVLVLVAGLAPGVRARFAAIAVAGAGLVLLAFSLSNPDGRVAARNVERWRHTGRLDVAYVQTLSADAMPALAQLPEPLRGDVLAPYRRRLAASEPWSSANRSRRNARAILAAETSLSARR
jgi:hypothetical protein